MRLGGISPTREEFAGLDQPLVPVRRRLLADSETAVGIYRKLAGNRPGTVLLESAEQGKQWSRYSFIGVRSAGVLTESRGRTQWLGDRLPGLTDDLPADPLAAANRRVVVVVLRDIPLRGAQSGAPARDAAGLDAARDAPARAQAGR